MKQNTKQIIFKEALMLFAKNGYEGVSVRDIAGAVGIRQSSLYKHYKSKQDIFAYIVEQMRLRYEEKMKELMIPQGSLSDRASQYATITFEQIKKMGVAIFFYWVEDEYASAYRRLLELEQYRNAKIAALYDQVLAGGAIYYLSELFEQMIQQGFFVKENPKLLAVEFYSPMFFFMSNYEVEKREEIQELVESHLDSFRIRYEKRNEYE